MNLFPVFQNIDDKKILVLGGGNVAKAKIRRLMQFTDKIKVIAKETDIDFIPVDKREFCYSDLENADLIVLALGDRKLEDEIAKECIDRGVLVNSASAPDSGNFYMPGIIKKGSLAIGISTGGNSPSYSKHLRKEIEALIPENIDEILLRLNEIRGKLKEDIPEQRMRQEILREIMLILIDKDNDISDDEIGKIVVRYK